MPSTPLTDAATDVRGEEPFSHSPFQADGALADPPAQACDADASSDGGVCPPPPSVCTDAHTLLYYDNGQCVSGQCTWQTRQMVCGYRCGGGCAPCSGAERYGGCLAGPTR